MATYVISDIHGEYDMFMELLEKIGLRDEDTLYILGDVLDRGPHPIKTVQKLMEMPNAVCLVGNHEQMAIECFSNYLMQFVTEEFISSMNEEMIHGLSSWLVNGGDTTIKEFRKLDMDEKQDVIDFIKDFELYEELLINGKEYLLVHSGLGNFSPEKEIEDYSLLELVWERADYDIQYFPDKFVVTGHTPTQEISGNPRPGYIYRHNNHIAIDCGAFIPGGRLAAICLDTGEEFYSSEK